MSARWSHALILAVLGSALAWPASAAIVLSEVQIAGDAASDEFVELFNTGSDAVSLKDWSLRRKSAGDMTAKGSSLKTFGASDTIAAGSHLLWASSGGSFKDHADTTTAGGLADNNSLGLFDKDGGLVDALTWGSGHALPFAPVSFGNPEKKASFVRDVATLTWSATKNISPTNASGAVWQAPVVIPPMPGELKNIVINEVYANPQEKGDAGEFVELYNPLEETVDLAGWELRDASASGKYIFPNGKTIEREAYLVITDADFTLSLNNSHETLSLYDRDKRLVHQVQYEKTKEGVTLNLVGGKLRGGRTPTPGKENLLNADPVTKERVPKKGFVDIPAAFQARGSDQDGDSLKYTWDFGDDRKSYKGKTTHTYRAKGRYTVTLTTDDGTDTTTETFEIKIEKYEAPKLRIVALSPNPEGKDSEHEWIEIENREKKSVDLRGFGIATGSKRKSISNHPIRDELVIKGRGVKRLTRDDSLFTLNNEKGYVELRDPTGEVIDRLKYDFDESLDEGVVLRKEKGKSLAVETPTEDVETEATAETDVLDEALTAQPKPEPATPPTVLGASIEVLQSQHEAPQPPAPLETRPKRFFLFEYWSHFWDRIF